MEPLWFFSATDNSIDLVVAIVFALAVFHALTNLWKNHLTIQGRIALFTIALLSGLHIFQTVNQLLIGGPTSLSVRLWDFINYINAMLFLALVIRIGNKERQ